MRAITRQAYGSADVLGLGEVAEPVPGDDEVVLRVRAAGVDQGVWHVLTGLPYVMRLGTGLRGPKSPFVGTDVAGEVRAVGAGVTAYKPGDRVFGTCGAAYAEYACAPAGRLVPMPANLSYEQAAAIPTAGMTALRALREAGRVRPGQRVLVIGAGGGVGTFAVQLAAHFGAHVTGVCSGSKAELVRSLGAEDVVDYTREDFADGRRPRYDLILDTAGLRPLSHLRRALTPRGTFVIVGGEGGGRWLAGLDRQLRTVLLGPFTRQRPRVVFAFPREADLRTLAELAGDGRIKAVVSGTYPLEQVPEAIRELEKGHVHGKLVITL
ncbi:NAD(P)-dependent alcohol dehydrogenase [Actinomadura sp. ATCC 31491]|uniref:NAD(P)-dependent alcohol dehydrogenase n=1 Tax=Actinomadura luzonensis TaxID=2805427 RepID=A0ABT0GAP4_9ACTN|nr:NAD(P)-dependent alcohol dehydrogenase [Actinomadura luzonensis]MCK2221678.1 NAD(P)-dependent alcohol dehydrogenase [Actinomadura luzonensis]